mmetsp:Transcript_16559/g.52822  ORF Transcript_16559/g.52822 Transcript_16559/m.52822 type:complete len:213 (+) Transcript_16559:2031-2669(+)
MRISSSDRLSRYSTATASPTTNPTSTSRTRTTARSMRRTSASLRPLRSAMIVRSDRLATTSRVDDPVLRESARLRVCDITSPAPAPAAPVAPPMCTQAVSAAFMTTGWSSDRSGGGRAPWRGRACARAEAESRPATGAAASRAAETTSGVLSSSPAPSSSAPPSLVSAPMLRRSDAPSGNCTSRGWSRGNAPPGRGSPSAPLLSDPIESLLP